MMSKICIYSQAQHVNCQGSTSQKSLIQSNSNSQCASIAISVVTPHCASQIRYLLLILFFPLLHHLFILFFLSLHADGSPRRSLHSTYILHLVFHYPMHATSCRGPDCFKEGHLGETAGQYRSQFSQFVTDLQFCHI